MRIKLSIIFGALVLIAAASLIAANTRVGQAQQNPPDILPKDVAIAKAIDAATSAGLQGVPTRTIARRMTLEEYMHIHAPTFEFGKDACKVGLCPNTPVWAVLVTGDIKYNRPASDGRLINDLTLALNAKTGKAIMWIPFAPGNTPPLAVQS